MRTILATFMVFNSARTVPVTTSALIDAIADVETHRGADDANVYQLRPIYVEDVCRITGQHITFEQAIDDDALARACIEAYWDHYGHWYWRITGKVADAEVLARMHNGGPDGWRKPSTLGYWRKVRSALMVNGGLK